MPEISIRRLSAQEVLPLRAKVLRPGQTIANVVFQGDEKPRTIHLGAIETAQSREQIVAVSTLLPELPPIGEAIEEKRDRLGVKPSELWRLRGMATDERYRRAGLGRMLIEVGKRHVQSEAGRVIWAHARTSALQFYLKIGFEALGDEYPIEGVGPHYFIVLIL